LDRADEQLEITVDPESLSQAAVQDVRKALTQLTPVHRVILVLIDIEEFTLVEAAEMLKIPIGTVASRLARARLELRQLLQVYQSKSSQSRGPS
jgi:RNA polymerase sigma-70 factor (ECF subfamily)